MTTSTSETLENNGKQPLPSTTFRCFICTDEKPKDKKFNFVGCDHSCYCSECIAKYVASKLEENVLKIECPAMGCEGSLDPQNCQSILPKRVFDRWCDALCESLIVRSEKYYYCPFKDCSALLIDSCGSEKEGVVLECECPECHRLFCAACRVPWHSSLKCSDYQSLNEDEGHNEDIKLVKLAETEKWMRCPNCRYYVERLDGCDHMTCRCEHDFCYKCGVSLTDDDDEEDDHSC